jgi:ABC-type transporter MlaC component
MRITRWVQRAFQGALIVAALSVSGLASADDAKAFLQREQTKLTTMLQKSSTTQAELSNAMAQVIDYDALTRQSFGEHYINGDLNDAQKAEVKGLLRTLIEKNYKKNLKKILDYKAEFGDPTGDDAAKHVKMKAQSTSNVRDKARIEYILRANGSSWMITEFIVEGSPTTSNYYRQFHEMLTNKDKGYKYVVQKLQDSIAKP